MKEEKWDIPFSSFLYIFISCSKTKKKYTTSAGDLYQGSLFKKSFHLSKLILNQRVGEVFILSALHGILTPSQLVAPYDEFLGRYSAIQLEEWKKKVRSQWRFIRDQRGHTDFTILFFAGEKYVFTQGIVPFDGLSLGFQGQWLSKRINEKEHEKKCHLL